MTGVAWCCRARSLCRNRTVEQSLLQQACHGAIGKRVLQTLISNLPPLLFLLSLPCSGQRLKYSLKFLEINREAKPYHDFLITRRQGSLSQHIVRTVKLASALDSQIVRALPDPKSVALLHRHQSLESMLRSTFLHRREIRYPLMTSLQN